MDDFNHTTQIETNIYSIIRSLQRSKKPFSVYLFLFFLPFASLRSSHLSEVHQVIQHFLINPTSLLLFWINVTAHRRRRICPPKRVVPPQSLRLISLTLRHTSLGPIRRHSTQQDAAWSAQKTAIVRGYWNWNMWFSWDRTFANLSKSPKPDCPAACFENFTNKWHKPYLQSPSIEAEKGINTRTESQKRRKKESSTILHEIEYKFYWSVEKQIKEAEWRENIEIIKSSEPYPGFVVE